MTPASNEVTQRSIPSFKIHEINKKQSEYCICVFVINEGERLHSQLTRMKPFADKVDIIIADGGSTDNSTDINKLENFHVNTLLTKTGDGKLGAQMRMAFAWSLDRGYKGVIVIDGNNKDSVENIPDFLRHLEEGYDHIQGSRFVSGGQHENTPTSRIIGLKLIHAPLIRIASGFRYTDTTNGFRAYSARLLSDPHISVFRDIFSGYELHYYLAVRSARLGFRCIEIPVKRIYPATGKTPTKISPLKGNLTVVLKLLQVISGKYNI